VRSADASVLAGELNLEHRSRLIVDLTNLVRGESVGRFGHEPVVRFRVSALPATTPVTPDELDALVEPVTRLRADIERDLRQTSTSEPDATRQTVDTSA